MSPLRYQKWLRLNEVRRQMLNEHYDVTTAAYAVGYESYPISVLLPETPMSRHNLLIILICSTVSVVRNK